MIELYLLPRFRGNPNRYNGNKSVEKFFFP